MNPIIGYENEPKMMERSYSDRNSLSEFEFSISSTTNYHSDQGVVHMLAADELFFKGKLLPLYLPEFSDYGSDIHEGVCDACNRINEFFPRTEGDDYFQQVPLISDNFTVRTTASTDEDDAENLVGKSLDMLSPVSPKTPKCSIRLKSLFGLKKLAKAYCSCAANSEEVSMVTSSSSSSSSSPIKFSRKKNQRTDLKSKHKSTAAMPHRNLDLLASDHCQSCDVSRENSAAEPLLRGYECHKDVVLPLYPSVNARKGQGHKDLKNSSHRIIVQRICDGSMSPNLCGDHLACIDSKQTSSKLSSTDSDGLLKAPGQGDMAIVAQWNTTPASDKQSTSHEEVYPYRGSAEKQCKEARRPSIHEARTQEATLERAGSCDSASEGRGSLVKQQEQLNLPRLIALNESRSVGINYSRSKSLERSYSPKSLQKKYDQLRMMRQREGWRVLERSSSYNSACSSSSGIHSMQVAPVLNVPIVCMSRSKSSNSATDRTCNLFFPTRKSHLDANSLRLTAGVVASANRPCVASTSKVKQQQKQQASRRYSPHDCNI
ncbi:hypothetical protein KP509_38G065600 [Ceratopteris richardii]|nr:hypothetical protein KP509_38G065600 [Ceratopteris richardii]